jgi:hypothetical protein
MMHAQTETEFSAFYDSFKVYFCEHQELTGYFDQYWLSKKEFLSKAWRTVGHPVHWKYSMY